MAAANDCIGPGVRLNRMWTTAFLIAAIAFEVGWAIAMKLSEGLTKLWPTVATIIMYLLSVVFLALATKKMEIGTAYAVWAGSGVALISIAGIAHFNEPLTAIKIVSVLLIVAGIIGLNLAGGAH